MWLSVVMAKTPDDNGFRSSCHRFSPVSSHVGFVVDGGTGTGFNPRTFFPRMSTVTPVLPSHSFTLTNAI
jgi:hypothetical protein